MTAISFLACLTTFSVLIPATFCIELLFEGEACKLRNGSEGICGKLSICEQAFSFPRNPPILCSTLGNIDIVCCPPEYFKETTSPPPPPPQRKTFEDTETCSLLVDRDPKEKSESLSARACQMYEEIYFDNSEMRHVVGGSKVKDITSFPFMAALGYRETNHRNGKDVTAIEYKCGGMLISDRFVLTAAHCETENGPVVVKMGTVNLEASTGKQFEVEKFITHPCYSMNESYYDIALVKLTKAIKASVFIFPACVFKEPEPPIMKQYNITGWGATSLSGIRRSKILLVASLTLLPPDECSSKWRSADSSLPRGFAENTMFCAANPIKGAACKGDSGGPLSLGTPNIQYTVLGIISLGGSACGDIDKPGLITNIYPFLLWIEDVIWPDGKLSPLTWDDEEEYQ